MYKGAGNATHKGGTNKHVGFNTTQAEHIAAKLIPERLSQNMSELQRLELAKRRITLRWFSFEAPDAHRYRNLLQGEV